MGTPDPMARLAAPLPTAVPAAPVLSTSRDNHIPVTARRGPSLCSALTKSQTVLSRLQTLWAGGELLSRRPPKGLSRGRRANVERGKAKASPVRAKVHGEQSKAAVLAEGRQQASAKKALVPSVVATPGAAGNPERGARGEERGLATSHCSWAREAGADGQALPVPLLL